MLKKCIAAYMHIHIFVIVFLFILPQYIFSLPEKSKVVNGCISFERTSDKMLITQKCEKAIIDWDDFSLNESETVKFIQKDNFSVLNRVVSDKISKIYGSIEAEGKFYLINQNGILIGPSGSISAKEVLLSTLELSKEDYLKNKDLRFVSFKDSNIKNFGSIEAIDSNIYILSKTIENYKNISAKKGRANLVSASEILILDGKKDIIIKPNLDGSITNEGEIKAIVVKLESNNNNLDSFAINQKGLIEANGFKKKDGKVILISQKGVINHTGVIIAKNLDETGGSVKLLGEHIILDENAKIDISSKFEGGKVLIGGDKQGKNSKIQNAKTVFVSKDSKIFADSLENGNGKKVIVFADEAQFYGSISTKGGVKKGDGGFVEISSKKYLDFQGIVDRSCSNGKNGTLLLDPFNVTIATPDNNITSSPNFRPTGTGSQLSPATIIANLALGDVSLNTSGGGGSEAGDITVAQQIGWTTETGNLTFIADHDIIVNNSITWASSSNLSLFAANNLSFNTATTLLIGGPSASGNILYQMNSISSATGVSFQSSGNIAFQSGAKSTTIGVGSSSTGTLAINNTVISSLVNGFSLIKVGDTTQVGTIDINGATFLDPLQILSDRIDVNGSLATTGNITFNIGLTKGGVLNLNSIVTATGGAFSVNGSATTSDTFNINVNPSSQTATFDGQTINNNINTLNGPTTSQASVVNWTISGPNSGSIGNIAFLNITDCIAKDTDDTFTLNSSTSFMNTINLGLGSNTFTITAGSVGNLLGGGSNNTYNFNGGSITDIVGSSLNNTFHINTGVTIAKITSGNGNNTYDINGGDVTNTIITGSGNDIFNFANGQRLTVSDGVVFAPSGAKELNYSAYSNTTRIFINLSNETIVIPTPAITLNPRSTYGFNLGAANTLINPTNLTNIVGNNPLVFNSSESELVGPSSTWEITGINSGTVDSIPYAGMPNINGTTSGDFFNFSATGTESRVRGLVGDDTFNFGFAAGAPAAWSGDVTIQLQGGANNDIFVFYKDVAITATIDGGPGGTNEIRGPPIDAGNLSTAWVISGAGSGTIQPSGIGIATNFSSIDILTGSDRADTFTITHNNAQTLSINGGTGTNKIIGPTPSTGNNTWTITANNGGTLKVGNPPQLISFSNIHQLEGNTGVDNFIFNGAFSISGTPGIDGKTGINSITGSDGVRNDWNITADNAGQITIDPLGVAAVTTFQNIQNLTGGNNIDNFTFNGAFQISGTTGIDVNGGVNTITGPNVANTWNLTSADTGQLSPFGATGATLFTNSGGGSLSLVGGTSSDSFTFASGSSLSGSINGNNAALNSIDVSAVALATISVEPGVGIILGGINNIQTITGNNNATTFIARNDTNLWTIGANNSAIVTNASDNINLITIGFFEGGIGNDTFSFTGNFAISGSINGKAGNNTIIASTGVDNTWNITDNNAGTLNPLGGSPTIFSNIQNLTGNIGTKDIFILSDGKGITGTVDGGACGEENTLDYSAYTTPATSSMPPCSAGLGTATNIGAIRFIDIFIGSKLVRSFVLEDAYKSELLVIYDLKNFAEFNRFLNSYKLIYIKKENLTRFLSLRPHLIENYKFLKRDNRNEILFPKFENLTFKDWKKD